MIRKKKLIVSKPISGGLLLSYKCSGACKHCLYNCSPEWNTDWISEADVTSYLSQLSTMIRPSPHGRGDAPILRGLEAVSKSPE